MNASAILRSRILRIAILGTVILVSIQLSGQSQLGLPASYHINGAGSPMTSNVPLNEINTHAFRHFRKLYPGISGESWIKTEEGYIVSFSEHGLRSQVHFDQRGGFLYSVKYYGAADFDRDLAGLINRRYPGYNIEVVTEITDNEKIFYLVKIETSTSLKTISVNDGKLEVIEELVNGKEVK